MQVELLKQNVEYKDKKGEKVKGVNLYLKVEQTIIPIDVKYFPNKDTGIDSQYFKRKFLLSTIANLMPNKKSNGSSISSQLQKVDSDDELPF